MIVFEASDETFCTSNFAGYAARCFFHDSALSHGGVLDRTIVARLFRLDESPRLAATEVLTGLATFFSVFQMSLDPSVGTTSIQVVSRKINIVVDR